MGIVTQITYLLINVRRVMAKIFNSATEETTTPTKTEKAEGFLNVYLPTASGGKQKLMYLSLKKSDLVHRQILKVMEEDPETGLQRIMSKIIIEFNRKTPDEERQLDL